MEVLLFLVLAVLMLAGLPIAYAIIASCLVYLGLSGLATDAVVTQQLTVGLDSFPLLAIPMFIFMGFILEKAQLSRHLVDWLVALIGTLRGGLGIVTVLACALLAALTGSGPATVVAIGSLMIPAMVAQAGYSRERATGLVSVAGALGPIVPPSIIMIIYGATMGVSIPDLFIGGIVPGLLLASALIVWIVLVSPKRTALTPSVREDSPGLLRLTLKALPVMLVPVAVIGGIYSGLVTPTEAAAIGIVAGVVLGLCYRSLGLAALKDSLLRTVTTSSLVGILIAAAGPLSWILTATDLPARVAEQVVPLIGSSTLYLMVLLIVLFIVGCLMESAASVIVLGPVLVPIGLELGVDPLHLGIVFCIALVAGYVTPPFGINLFTAVSVSGLRYGQVVRGSMAPLLVFIGVIVLIAFVPALATGLPRLLE